MNYGDLKALGKDLLALTLNGSPRWRVLVLGSLLALAGSAAWGYMNYARANEVDSLKNDVNEIKVQLLAQSILSACKEKYHAQQEGNYPQYWQEHLAKLKHEYFRMTGQGFELPPSC